MRNKGRGCRVVLLGVLLLVGAWTAGAQSLAGDARRGEALYVGTQSFSQGGAPCLACHGISGAGLGLAAGANFGPDLTSMHANFGGDGVLSILESLTDFASMEPIYANRPLTADEQADVAAFLADVSGQTPFETGARLLGHVAVWTGALLVVLVLAGWGRFKGARRPLVESARMRKGGLQ
ncbi:c-type cytochrome [Geoalkalibacter sp.]|uniref:c-type cytochrome n=1 Tax=Geoalkalibacter sp. TaxID=3041440 RepID=UPI00272DFC12|nr:c-type cytochrome [Geoalkalibacter sp.]